MCRNEDVLLPESIQELSIDAFNKLDGYELRFETNENSFLVGYNRFQAYEEMYGYMEVTGDPIKKEEYE